MQLRPAMVTSPDHLRRSILAQAQVAITVFAEETVTWLSSSVK